MPSKIDKLKLSEKQDRRVKLTTEDKEEIKKMYSTGLYSLNMLAKKYGVSKKLILITVNPKSKQKSKEYTKNNWKNWQRSKEERNEYSKATRRYKKDLYDKGELK